LYSKKRYGNKAGKNLKEWIMPQRFWTRSLLFLIAIIGGWILLPQGLLAQVSAGFDKTKEPWDIEARELSYDNETEFYTASGEVVIKKGTQTLKCDYAQVNKVTMMAMARGHVEFISGGDRLTGDEMTVDLEKKTGQLKNGRIFLKENHFYVTGDEIFKTGESTYRAVNATVTSCDGEKVPWEITASEVKVTVDGYGQAWHPAMRVRSLPVLYSPYLLFPAKTTRQSGLLMPAIGQSSRDGFTVNLPIYWAISGNTDATLNEYYMSNRGLMQGAEFRYVLSNESKGTLMFDYLPKDNLSQQEYQKGNISEPYTDRYWFRSKINQALPAEISLKLDLDYVSDRDYLKEFKTIPFGLDQNRRTFLGEYSRDLDDETQVNRRNSATVAKSFGTSNLTGGINYYQNVDKTGTAMNQLPYLQFGTIKQKWGENFFYQVGASYNNYYRENLDRGNVIDFSPTVYYPFKLKNYMNLEPSVGLVETVYQASNVQSTTVDSTGNRTVPTFRLDTSTDFQRIFSFSGGDLDKIKHNIRPQVIYNYIPDIKQDSLPSFITPVTKTNTVSYFLINTLTSKTVAGKDSKGENMYGYLDFMTFKAYQTYDINTAQGNNQGVPSSQPFSDIFGELEFLPGPYMTLRSSVGWNPYTGQFDSQTHNMTLSDKSGNRAYVEYLSSSGDQFRQINSDVLWKISQNWTANFLTKYSLDQNKNYQTDFGLAYSQQCWGIKVTYSDTPDNKTFLLSFSLKGLGEF
jgi:LPS-assembly protein